MEQKERIISQASRMFWQMGVKSVRMDDIASEAGVSKRTLYEMFSDKEELIFHCMLHHVELENRRHSEITAGCTNILEATLTVLREMMDKSEQNYRLKSEIAKFYPNAMKRIMECDLTRKHYVAMRESMVRGIEQGLLMENLDLDLALSIHFLVLSGLNSSNDFTIPSNIKPRDAFAFVIINFFRGIATEKGARIIDKLVEDNRINRR